MYCHSHIHSTRVSPFLEGTETPSRHHTCYWAVQGLVQLVPYCCHYPRFHGSSSHTRVGSRQVEHPQLSPSSPPSQPTSPRPEAWPQADCSWSNRPSWQPFLSVLLESCTGPVYSFGAQRNLASCAYGEPSLVVPRVSAGYFSSLMSPSHMGPSPPGTRTWVFLSHTKERASCLSLLVVGGGKIET